MASRWILKEYLLFWLAYFLSGFYREYLSGFKMKGFSSILSLVVAIVGVVSGEFYSNSTSDLSCGYSATCTAAGVSGVCVSISAGCCSGGTTTANLCPGSSDVKCCTKRACSTPSGSGTCLATSACSGKSVAGYCTGPSNLQCCVTSGPTPSGKITRGEMMSRAQDWVNRKIPYSQSKTTGN